jgi:preprotein translocase subunit SecA
VLEYDDVMNRQREAIYNERNAILDGKDIHARAEDILQDTVEKAVSTYAASVSDDWDWEGLAAWLSELTGDKDFDPHTLKHDNDSEKLAAALFDYLSEILAQKEATIGEEKMRQLESQIMLRIMDSRWMNHLQDMDYLKAGIGLRAFGQRDPLTEYKTEAHAAFGELRDSMYDDYLRTLLRIQIVVTAEQAPAQLQNASYSGPAEGLSSSFAAARAQASERQAGQLSAARAGMGPEAGQGKAPTVTKDKNDPYANVGPNDPCPCGSGKKYKKCHGAWDRRSS